jgi:hypothetical protein
MANAKKCDRCEGFFDNNEATKKVEDNMVVKVSVLWNYNESDEKDICDKCRRELALKFARIKK